MRQQAKLELARRYLRGDYNDIQLNYWIVQNKFEKQEIDNLITSVSIFDPFATVCKVLIAFMMMHFIVCVVYSLMCYYS